MSEQDPKIGPTIRHGEAKPFEFAAGDSENIAAISSHIERWIGRPDNVFHEIVSDKVHIDIHIVAPSEKFPFYTLVTSGMSDRPMNAPEGAKEFCYSELFLCLPPDWKMSQDDWKSSRYFWPIQSLKFLARFPHQYNTWLFYGHTIPNGDPPSPLNEHTKMSGFILLEPHCIPPEFLELKISEQKTIYFLSVVPMYSDEMALKLKKGAEAFESALVDAGYSELLDPTRPSVAPKGGFFRRLFGG
jgi:hypothetical protein